MASVRAADVKDNSKLDIGGPVGRSQQQTGDYNSYSNVDAGQRFVIHTGQRMTSAQLATGHQDSLYSYISNDARYPVTENMNCHEVTNSGQPATYQQGQGQPMTASSVPVQSNHSTVFHQGRQVSERTSDHFRTSHTGQYTNADIGQGHTTTADSDQHLTSHPGDLNPVNRGQGQLRAAETGYFSHSGLSFMSESSQGHSKFKAADPFYCSAADSAGDEDQNPSISTGQGREITDHTGNISMLAPGQGRSSAADTDAQVTGHISTSGCGDRVHQTCPVLNQAAAADSCQPSTSLDRTVTDPGQMSIDEVEQGAEVKSDISEIASIGRCITLHLVSGTKTKISLRQMLEGGEGGMDYEKEESTITTSGTFPPRSPHDSAGSRPVSKATGVSLQSQRSVVVDGVANSKAEKTSVPEVSFQNGYRGSCSSSMQKRSSLKRNAAGQPVNFVQTDVQNDFVEKPYFCAECGSSFTHLDEFERHVQTHTSEKPFICSLCERAFRKAQNLKKHMRSHSDEKPFACTECDKAFKKPESLKKHKLNHAKEQSDTGEKPFPCKRCDAAFSRSDSLRRHMSRSHAGEKPYPCGECDAAFYVFFELKTHMRVHAKNQRLTCDHCGASFTQEDCLKRHIRTHTTEKPFTCHLCGLSFLQSGGLREHLNSHHAQHRSGNKMDMSAQTVETGRKPFSCVHCYSSFSRASTLKIHMRIHTGVKCFTCHECGASFGQSVHYRDHMRIHTGDKPYACTHCNACFAQSGHLKRHMRTHTGERCFICRECGASFAQSGNLKSHMRIHTGERPYACDQCDASFTQSGHLKRHLQKHLCEESQGLVSEQSS